MCELTSLEIGSSKEGNQAGRSANNTEFLMTQHRSLSIDEGRPQFPTETEGQVIQLLLGQSGCEGSYRGPRHHVNTLGSNLHQSTVFIYYIIIH